MKRYSLILWLLIAAMVICVTAGVAIMSIGLPNKVTEIRTEAELLELLDNSNSTSRVHAVLKEDVTLNTTFEPTCFYGIFDGCGHTVTVGNNRVEKLFDTVANGSTVLNLNIKGTFGSSDSSYVMGICEYNQGKIANCCISANFNAKSGAAGICRQNAGIIVNCAVLGKSFGTGVGRPVWSPVTEENVGTIENCFYPKENADGYGTGLTAAECTDGTLAEKLNAYARNESEFVSWKIGADNLPILLTESGGGTASVFSSGLEIFVLLCIIVVFATLMIYTVFYFDKRKKFRDLQKGAA